MFKHTFLRIVYVLLALPIIYVLYLKFIYVNNDWKQRTTPLQSSTIETLCLNFDLKEDDVLCNKTEAIYGPDFYRVIRDTFRPYEAYEIPSSESATYEDVEKKIGLFRYECDPVVHQSDGFSYFRCQYDLHGDREFIIGIIYSYPDNAVFRINTPMGFDGE